MGIILKKGVLQFTPYTCTLRAK